MRQDTVLTRVQGTGIHREQAHPSAKQLGNIHQNEYKPLTQLHPPTSGDMQTPPPLPRPQRGIYSNSIAGIDKHSEII